MSTIKPAEVRGLPAALVASRRSLEIPESLDAYGWLIGSWKLNVYHYRGIDVSARGITGEVHFAWVLEGRAVQDVWIMPPRPERKPDIEKTMNMYGTTLRVWDPSIQAWRITWINPVSNHHEEQVGRWSGNDVVQVGSRFDGTPTRWRYTEIMPDSFHWLGEALEPDGKTWKLEGEFRAVRIQ